MSFLLLVTLILNEELGAVNDPEIFVAVKLLINVAFVPNDPEMPADVNPTAPPSSKNATLLENEELGAANDPDIIADVNTGFASNVVVLVLNDPLSVFKLVILVLNDALGATNEPDIIDALNTGFNSNVATLVLNDADGDINEPDIPVAVKLLINVAFVPNEPEILVELNTGLDSNVVVLVLNDPLSIFKFDTLVENEADGATNDPEMLAAICADPDNVPGVTVGLFSSTATLVLKLALGALNDPDIIVDVNTGFDSNTVVLVLNEADEALNDPDIIADVNTGFASNEVTLVEIDELGAVNDPEIFVAVKLLINSAFVPNEPDIIADVNTSFPSNEATLVLNDPLSVFKLVILELKLELVFVNEPDIFAAVKLLINTALGPRDPDIPEAVNPTAPPPSKNVILLEIEELGDVNDPLIFEAICADPDINVFVVINSLAVILVLNDPLSVFKLVILRPRLDDTDVNDPLIFEAICADPDKVPGAVIFNNVDPSPTNDPLNTEPVTA